MAAKISSILILAFLYIQASPLIKAQNTYHDNNGGHFDESETLEELLNRINEALESLTEKVEENLFKLKQEIKTIVDSVNIDQIVEKFVIWLKETTGASEEADRCIQRQLPAIRKLAEEFRSGSLGCVESGESRILDIRKKVDVLLHDASNLKEDAVEFFSSCYKEHPNDPELQKCLDKMAEIVNNLIFALDGMVEELVQESKEGADEATRNLEVCMYGVLKTLLQKQGIILNNVMACLNDEV